MFHNFPKQLLRDAACLAFLANFPPKARIVARTVRNASTREIAFPGVAFLRKIRLQVKFFHSQGS